MEFKTIDIINAMVTAVNDNKKLTIALNTDQNAIDQHSLVMNGRLIGSGFEIYDTFSKNIEDMVFMVVNFLIIPTEDELPEAYTAGLDFIENNVDALGNTRDFWKELISQIRI